MVNKPLIRPYFLGGVALGGAARIPLRKSSGVFYSHFFRINTLSLSRGHSFYFQPKQFTIIFRKSVKITSNICCLFHPPPKVGSLMTLLRFCIQSLHKHLKPYVLPPWQFANPLHRRMPHRCHRHQKGQWVQDLTPVFSRVKHQGGPHKKGCVLWWQKRKEFNWTKKTTRTISTNENYEFIGAWPSPKMPTTRIPTY